MAITNGTNHPHGSGSMDRSYSCHQYYSWFKSTFVAAGGHTAGKKWMARDTNSAKDTNSLGLTDGQKTRLLHLAIGPPDPGEPRSEDEERGDLLHDILRCSLPLRADSHGGLRDAGAAPSQGLRSVVGPPIGELLLDPKTGIDLLKDIKVYAKARGSQATSEREKDVFLAIYFAAIAAALVSRQERITEHSEGNVAQFLHSLANMVWIPDNLADLFREAMPPCQETKTGGDA